MSARLLIRIAAVLVSLAVLSGFAVASGIAGDPVDRNGIPTDPDAMARTLQQASGASIDVICRLESEAWPPAPPTEAEIKEASTAEGKPLINGRFVLGSAREAARTLDVEIGWADGDGASFWAIKASQKYPTVVRVDELVVGAHQLWRIGSWVELGACDRELVPLPDAAFSARLRLVPRMAGANVNKALTRQSRVKWSGAW